VTGLLSLGWLSPSFRTATLRIHREAVSEAPNDNGQGLDWAAVLEAVGWDFSFGESDTIPTPGPDLGIWTFDQLHATMLALRESNPDNATDLDRTWIYTLMCVRRVRQRTETADLRGAMFDFGEADTNHAPREGSAIASHWMIPDSPEWGKVRGQRLGASPAAYFRAAVHEVGHALGLNHPNGRPELYFMQESNVIAELSLKPDSAPFPDNAVLSFSPEDVARLRHFPDVHIRPGGEGLENGLRYAPDLPVGGDLDVAPGE
jgi:hypothetical protein